MVSRARLYERHVLCFHAEAQARACATHLTGGGLRPEPPYRLDVERLAWRVSIYTARDERLADLLRQVASSLGGVHLQSSSDALGSAPPPRPNIWRRLWASLMRDTRGR